jgi:hypothetical protein
MDRRRQLEEDENPHRRRHSRRKIQLPAQLIWHGQQFAAQTENISPGGAQLSVRLPPGATEVLATIDLNTGRAVRVHARIRWQQPTSVGVEFSSFLAPFDETG